MIIAAGIIKSAALIAIITGLITSSKNIDLLLYANYFFFQSLIKSTTRMDNATAASAFSELMRGLLTRSSKNIVDPPVKKSL